MTLISRTDLRDKVRFLTNSTKSSREEILNQLWDLGFPESLAQNETLVTNAQAAGDLIRKKNLRPYCLVQESLLQDLRLDDGADQDYNCVLVGLAPKAFVYDRLNQAFRVIMKEMNRRKEKNEKDFPPLIIALHRGKYLRDTDGGLSLGPGGFVGCLQEATGISDSAIAIIGKPSCQFFRAGVPEGIHPHETAMIGDDVRQDVAGAKEAGLGLGILVKTGKYQDGDPSTVPPDVAPDYVATSIVEAVDYILASTHRI